MFCEKCGNRLPDNAKFCGVCGAKLNDAMTNGTGGNNFAEQFGSNNPFTASAPKQRVKWWQVLITVLPCLLIIGTTAAIISSRNSGVDKAKTSESKQISSSQTESSENSSADSDDSIKLEYSDLSNIGRSSIEELLSEEQYLKSGVETLDNLSIIEFARALEDYSLLDRGLFDKYFVEEYDYPSDVYQSAKKLREKTRNKGDWHITDSISESMLETVKEKLMETAEDYDRGTTDEENEKVREMITEEVEGLEGIYLCTYELEPELISELEAEFETEISEYAAQYLVVKVDGKYFVTVSQEIKAFACYL